MLGKKNNKKVVKKVNKSETKKDAKKEVNKNRKSWFKDFKAELKKVIWPSGKELANNTIVVLSMVIIVAVIIFVLDITFESLTKLEVKSIQSIKNSVVVSNTVDNTVENGVAIEETTNNNSQDATTQNN